MKFIGEVVAIKDHNDFLETRWLGVTVAGLNGDRRVMEISVPYREAKAYHVGRRVVIRTQPR